MSKSYSALFKGTFGTTYLGKSTFEESYTDRGIEVPQDIKESLSELKSEGDYISKAGDAFSMKEVSIMSKEEGVEFAKVRIGDCTYLVRGNDKTTTIPHDLLSEMAKYKGQIEFHSHPHNNDLMPSRDDMKTIGLLSKITGQKISKIVTPNGRVAIFGEHGVFEVGTVSNILDEHSKEIYRKLFGGK